MLSGILIAIGCWFLTGFVIYSLKVFVYCHGPKHYMDLNVMILKMRKSPVVQQIIEQRQKVGDGAFVIGAFIIATISGPLIIIDFIRFSILLNKCWKILEKNGG